MRANWSALLESIPDFRAEILRSAVDGDTVFVEVHWTGGKADGTPFEERGVLIMGIRDDRIAWGRLYADEVEREGADIDAVVRRMAGPKTTSADDATRRPAAVPAATQRSGKITLPSSASPNPGLCATSHTWPSRSRKAPA